MAKVRCEARERAVGPGAVLTMAVLAMAMLAMACSQGGETNTAAATNDEGETAEAADNNQPETNDEAASNDDEAVGENEGESGERTDDGFFVAALLAEIPAAVVDQEAALFIVAGDFDAAAEQAGAPRPGADTTDDERLEWMMRITGFPGETANPVHVILPEAVVPTNLNFAADFADELGWNVHDVTRFVEYLVPPGTFTVLEGDFTDADLDAAMGQRVDGIWSVGPDDDFAVDIVDRTMARPIGQSLRLALAGDRLAVSRSRPPITAWLTGTDDTLAGDSALLDVAEALDDAGVYSAMLVRADDFSVEVALAALPPDEVERLTQQSLLDPFSTLGVGLSVVGGVPVATFAYHFGHPATAEANAARLRELVETGTGVRDEPFNEWLAVRSVEAQGSVLVGSFAVPDRAPGIVWNIVHARDLLALHN